MNIVVARLATGIAAGCLAAAAAWASAAEVGPPERWLDWQNNHVAMASTMAHCDVVPALAAQWDEHLLQLAQRMASTPLPWPEGWYGEMRGTYNAMQSEAMPCKALPMNGYITFSVWPLGRPGPARGLARSPRAEASSEGSGAPHSVYVHVNQLRGTTELDWLNDGSDPRMTVGRPTSRLSGYPVWGNRWLLVSSPQHAQPFLPATLERVVNARVAAQTAEIDKFTAIKKRAEAAEDKAAFDLYTQLIASTRASIEQTRKLLDGPPERARGPAYFGPGDEVQAQPSPASQQVWIDNPAYFDPGLPRTAVQLIAIDIGNLRLDAPASANADADADAKGLARQFFERTDWQGIAKDLLH
jgi:hypothetical protein